MEPIGLGDLAAALFGTQPVIRRSTIVHLATWAVVWSGAGMATSAETSERPFEALASIAWSENRFRTALTHLADQQQVAIVLDRRVDPEQRVTMRRTGMPLALLLGEVAEERGLGLALLGSVAYLGPLDAAAMLHPLADMRRDEASALPSAAAKRFAQRRRFAWDDLVAPRELLDRLAEEGQFEIQGARLPHDLWAAASLPPLPLVDRMTLVAHQFDLTFEIAADGRKVTLVPAPDPATFERPRSGKSRAQEERPASKAVKKTNPGNQAGEARYTQKPTRGPLGVLLQQLARAFDLEVRIDRRALDAAGISLERMVEFQATEATMDGLFEALLAPAGLSGRREGKVLEVRPKGK